MKLLHRLLYRLLPLEWYLRAVSGLFFIYIRIGLGRRSEATEYVWLLPQLVREGDTCIDIEGYELHVMRELRPLLERHRPTVLIETGGANRPQIIALFTELGYRGMTLECGRLIPLAAGSDKDIVFLPD